MTRALVTRIAIVAGWLHEAEDDRDLVRPLSLIVPAIVSRALVPMQWVVPSLGVKAKASGPRLKGSAQCGRLPVPRTHTGTSGFVL